MANEMILQISEKLKSREANIKHLAKRYPDFDFTSFSLGVNMAISREPKLGGCSQESIMLAINQCAQYALYPGSVKQHCHLIPYGKECKMMLDYKGMIELAGREGILIDSQAIYKDEEFYFDKVENKIIHKTTMTSFLEPGELVGSWARATKMESKLILKTEAMNKIDIEIVRSKSLMKNGNAWKDFTSEMYRKTVIRRLFKTLPLSFETMKIIKEDADLDFERNVDISIVEPALIQDGKIDFNGDKKEDKKGKS